MPTSPGWATAGREVPAAAGHFFAVLAAGRDAAVRFCNERLAAGNLVHGYEVDDACRDVIADAGYGDAFFHRTGHSLGVTGHYNGVNIDNLETRDRRSLIPNVMFTVEPGIYLPDFNFDGSASAKGIGLRTEINCLVHARPRRGDDAAAAEGNCHAHVTYRGAQRHVLGILMQKKQFSLHPGASLSLSPAWWTCSTPR